MTGSHSLRLIEGDWTLLGARALQVREAVFVHEQGVPADLEHDTWDAGAHHVIAVLDEAVVGTGRLLADGHLGRLAVLSEHRGRGIGFALMQSLMARAAALAMPELILHAQTHAEVFYQRLGFVAEGPSFIEAGIAHRVMRWRRLPLQV